MDKEEIKDLIVQKVTDLNGCKATELAADLDIVQTLIGTGYEFPTLVQELVEENRLKEVEYILPDMPYRIKSFLLPKHTEVKVF